MDGDPTRFCGETWKKGTDEARLPRLKELLLQEVANVEVELSRAEGTIRGFGTIGRSRIGLTAWARSSRASRRGQPDGERRRSQEWSCGLERLEARATPDERLTFIGGVGPAAMPEPNPRGEVLMGVSHGQI